jgi:ankyrin repeat protein
MNSTPSFLASIALAACLWAGEGAVHAAVSGSAASQAERRLATLGLATRQGAFADAVAIRHDRLVELFISANVNLTEPDSRGRTPLHHAIAHRNWPLADRLLTADPTATSIADSEGLTPLMLAAAHGHAPIIRRLLDAGADPNAADESGRTSLHYAIAAKRLDVSVTLLESGARADLRDDASRDALAYAVESRDWQFIEVALSSMPEGRAWDFFGRSALQKALNRQEPRAVRSVLEKHGGHPSPEGCKDPLLAYAVAANDVRLVRLLLDAGADPNTSFESTAEAQFLEKMPHRFLRHYLTNEPGITVLMVAAGLGNPEMVQLLLDYGAQRGRATTSKHRLVPLYFAAWGDHAECLQVLIGNAPSADEMRIEISLSSQKATLYKDGSAVFSTQISTGRSGFQTPTGRFVVTDKKQSHISSIYKVKMPFFMRLSCKDFGLHQGVVPNYPASHGCIRLPSEAAQKFFKQVPIGTLVTIRD